MSTAKCTGADVHDFRALAGRLIFLDHVVIPPAFLVSRRLQKWILDLIFHHLSSTKNDLCALKKLQPTLIFLFPSQPDAPSQCMVLMLVGVRTSPTVYCKNGVISGLLLSMWDGSDDQIFHLLLSHSSKQAGISFSSNGA